MGAEAWALIGTLVVSAATLGAAWLTMRGGRKAMDAEADTSVVTAALAIVNERNDELDGLKADHVAVREELEDVRQELRAFEMWAKALVAQVVELGGVPVPFESYQKSRAS